MPHVPPRSPLENCVTVWAAHFWLLHPAILPQASPRACRPRPTNQLRERRLICCTLRPSRTMSSPGNIFITGVGIGIGNAAALHFASQGWRVYGSVLDQGELEALGTGRSKLAGVYTFDIRDEQGLAQAAAQVAAALPPGQGLDVLLNNAGLASCEPFELATTDLFRRIYEVNVFGTASVTRAFLPLLRKAAAASPGRGRQPRIIFMSSIVGRIGLPWMSVYASSKFAVEALCDCLRLELKAQGIQVVAVEPLFVKTKLPGGMWSTAEATMKSADPTVAQLYAGGFSQSVSVMRSMAEHLDISVAHVVRTLDDAANQQQPAPRMPVGAQTAVFIWLRNRVLPDTWWDALAPWAEWVESVLAGWVKHAKQGGVSAKVQ